METIYKYELGVVDEQFIEIPVGATTLTVQVQQGVPCLWVRIDPSNMKLPRKIITHGTGHPVPETTGDYIGTYQLRDGRLIYHVFEAA